MKSICTHTKRFRISFRSLTQQAQSSRSSFLFVGCNQNHLTFNSTITGDSLDFCEHLLRVLVSTQQPKYLHRRFKYPLWRCDKGARKGLLYLSAVGITQSWHRYYNSVWNTIKIFKKVNLCNALGQTKMGTENQSLQIVSEFKKAAPWSTFGRDYAINSK